MAFACRIVADSVTERGHRLTTMVVTLPRIVLAEFNTHRVFSRNSASSRAIPTRKQLQAIVDDYFMPEQFGTAVSGMNAGPPLEGVQLEVAQTLWRKAMRKQIWAALRLTTSPAYIRREWSGFKGSLDEFVLEIARRIEDPENPIHQESLLWTSKGLTNRLLEPFMWQTVIVTATEWENFFNLRTDANAQEEIRTAANLMLKAYTESTPVLLKEGEWHLPFIQPDELEWAKANPELARMAVVARCARVSYLTHDTGTVDIEKDIKLAKRLASAGHMSPFEHAATPIGEAEWGVRSEMANAVLHATEVLPEHVVKLLVDSTEFSGNFRGWAQYRRDLPNQQVYLGSAA